MINNIPSELKKLNQWVLWKVELKKDKNGETKLTKIPYQINDKKAESNDKSTWNTFDKVLDKYNNNGKSYNGVGFVLTAEDPYTIVDFDHVIKDGVINKDVKEWIDKFNSYTEFSQSHNGLHIVVKGVKPGDKCKKIMDKTSNIHYEIYSNLRYFALTGNTYGEYKTIGNRQEVINEFYNSVFNKHSTVNKAVTEKNDITLDAQKIIELLNKERNGKAARLLAGDMTAYGNDHSSAEEALCFKIAGYTHDESIIDEIVRSSGLARDKWDRQDYRDRTIQKAIENIEIFYEKNKDIRQAKQTKPLPPPESTVKKTKNIIFNEARKYLKEKYMFKKNVVTLKTEIYFLKDNKMEELNDDHFSKIYIELQDQKIFIGVNDLQMLITGEAKEYDPIFDFIEALPEPKIRDVDYINGFTDAISLLDETERTLFRNAFKMWFTGILTGVYPCNYCNHEMFILVGKQGLKKTTIFNSLIPDEIKLYLQENGNLNEDTKDVKAAMCTHLLINIDELDCFNKKDVDTLKSLITTKNFDIRLPYEHFSRKLRKRASFCGSTNKNDFLRDITGSRRFLIFEVDRIDLEAINNELIKNMWWQARELFKSGFKYYLSEEDIEKINARNERFVQEDWIKDVMLKYLKPAPVFEDGANIELLTTTEIARYLISVEHLGDGQLSNLVRKLGPYLKKYNYIRKSVKKNNIPVYKYAVIKEKIYLLPEQSIDI